MLQRALAVFSLLLTAGFAAAGNTPLLVNFQGKLLDAATNAPKNGSVSFQFRIYDAVSGGSVIWGPESQTVTVTNGVFAAQLGSVLSLSTDVFSGANAYLSVCAAPDACPSGEMTPRQQLVASPYAVTAQQIASAGGIRVNPGVAYSTFTSGGDLQVDNGVNASTGVFTATGNQVFSVTASSGLQINAGTLDFNGGSIDAFQSGIRAATGTFLATGNAQYSLYLSSGLLINAGMLDFNGAGINAAGAEIKASTFTGSGANLNGVTPQISDSSSTTGAALTANTDTVIVSTNIRVAILQKTVLAMGYVSLTLINQAGTCQVRLRFNAAGACGTGSATFAVMPFAFVSNSGQQIPFPIFGQLAPNSTADVSYCMTVNCTRALTWSDAHMSIIAGAP